MAPAWYFAPQKPEVGEAGWQTAAAMSGVLGDGAIVGLDNPANATMLLQIAGEFADAGVKKRIWETAEAHIEPTWDRERGEFTLGLGLDEAHPRGQWNARLMAGWVCERGAWSRLFNAPNLAKFEEPTITGVDFPRVALSQARWDGSRLALAAHPQNNLARGTTTTLRVTNLPSAAGWRMIDADGQETALQVEGGDTEVALVADNRRIVIQPTDMSA